MTRSTAWWRPNSTGESFEYVYDAAGNRTAMTTTAGATLYQYDAANRLTSINGEPLAWDNNGNLLEAPGARYLYDAANRLISVKQDDNLYEFAYNGLGGRLQQTVNEAEVTN